MLLDVGLTRRCFKTWWGIDVDNLGEVQAAFCWDNAVSELFFATLEKELVFRTRFESRSEAARAIALH